MTRPLCVPLHWPYRRNPTEVAYLAVAIEAAEVPGNDVPIVTLAPASRRILINLVIRA
jgi:hypothetical protein